jgi:PAS domain S-box-containing protein
MSPEQMATDSQVSRELLRAAIVDDRWDAYATNTRMQGSTYAKLGVSFRGWYEVIRSFQVVLVPALLGAYAGDLPRSAGAVMAMMAFIDHAMTLIAEQYMHTREDDRFRLLVEAVEDYAIFMLDADGLVASWNAGAKALTAYEESEIVGKHFSIFCPPGRRQSGEVEEELKVAATKGRWEGEGWRVRKDGSQFWANVVLTAVRDSRGKLIGFAKVTRDLTERMRAESDLNALVQRLERRTRQLEEANAELDGFTYSVSHDLRAPLRAIDGFARVLVEDCAPLLDADAKKTVDVICRNTQKMGRLIDDLLNFAKLGRHEVRRVRIDMAALVRTIAEEVREPGRSIEIRIADLLQAPGDPALLRQAWFNLLSNAVKYTRSRTHAVIDVTAEMRASEVVYCVKDNGVGFDPQYKSKLFGVFQRLHPASQFEGTGVGLALVQRIVHRHGGWVNAEATLGEGATFSFALPVKEIADEP